MAIRPEISLEAGKIAGGQPQLDLAKTMTQLYTLGNLAQQQQANVEAVTQARLLTQQKTREEEARKRLAALAKDNTTVDKNTGKVRVNHRAIAEQAAFEGMDADIVQNHLTKAISNEQSGLKTDQDKNDLLEKNSVVVQNLLRVQTDPMRAEQILQNQIERDAQVVGPEMAGKFYSSRYPVNTDPIKQAQINYQTTVTLPEKQQMQIEAATAEREAAKSYASPEARDAASDQSVKLRQRLAAQGIQVPDTASAFDVMNDLILKKQVEALVPGEAARISAAEKLTAVQSAADTIREGITAAENVKGSIKLPTKLGTFLKNKIDTAIKEHPELGVLKNAISAHNQQFPDSPINIETDNLETIINTLQSVEGKLKGIAKKEKGIAVEPSLPKALEGGKEKPVPKGMVKIMRLSDGDIKTASKDQADRFVATGQFKIVGK